MKRAFVGLGAAALILSAIPALAQEAFAPAPVVPLASQPAPGLVVDAPLPAQLAKGLVVIRYRT